MRLHSVGIARVCASVFLVAWTTTAVTQPIVGLAGHKYHRLYAPVLERMGVRAQPITGEVLEDPAALSDYDALIIVHKGDPGQEEYGLTETAEGVVAEYLRNGGRALLTYGCAPPPDVITGDFTNFGHGPHWVVADSAHPIVEGWEAGRAIQHGRYRSRIRGLGEGADVLVREPSGTPMVVATQFGEGALVYTGADVGHSGYYDGTMEELRNRILRWVVYGRVQDRFGPELTSRSPVKRYDAVHTARELVRGSEPQGTTLCRLDMAQATDLELDPYQVSAGEPDQWVIDAPEGRQVFAPWHTVKLGEAPVQPGQRYRVTGEVRLTGVNPDNFAAARFELRFYDGDGMELTHDHYATEDPSPGEWQKLVGSDAAPEGAANASMSLTVMLPAGELNVRHAVLQQEMTTEELMAAEEPLDTDVPHPRLLPEAAADFEAWVSSEQRGVYRTSRAEIFAPIVSRADEWMQETEMVLGEITLPWPPTEMPQEAGGHTWNPMISGIEARLVDLSLAYQGTGDQRYGQRAVELLLAISNWSSWYDPVPGPIHVEKQGEQMRLRSLSPESMQFGYVIWPGAEQFHPYLQIDHPPAEETVLVNLLEFGETTAGNLATEVDDGVVEITFTSGGADYRIRLHLVSEDNGGPAITVTRDGEVLIDRDAPGIPDDAVG